MSLNTTAVRIKVTLKDVKPEVMRRLVVPVTLRLDRLHLTLQEAFGWTNSHLFEFFAGEDRWGIPDPHNDYGHQPMDASKARLCDIVRETGAKTIHYLYDFGDSWHHVIKLEKWFDNTTTEGLPFLLEAAGRCPPEDVGGAPGYAEYLAAISDPAHPEHEHMRLWGPERFDPNVVDRKALEAAVNALSDIWKPRRRAMRTKKRQAPIKRAAALRLRLIGMTNVLSSIGYPHWLMIAGGLLVVLGFVGLWMLAQSVQAEPDAIAAEIDILRMVDLAEADFTDPPVKKGRRDRWAERELKLKEGSNEGPEPYAKRSG